MENLLVVSSSEKGRDFFTSLFQSGEFSRISTAASGGEARRMLISADFDLIVVNAPLADEFGHELAVQLTLNTMAGVLLAVKGELAEEVGRKVEDYGVFVIPKPVSRQLVYQALKMAEASQKRLSCLRDENRRLQRKLEEMRLVDRAKCALIEHLGMTEQQAHRHIEKQAMDLRTTKREIAGEIIKAYES